MDDEGRPIDVAYLEGAFAPGSLRQISTMMRDLLRNAKLDASSSVPMQPMRGSNRDEMIEVCNALLEPIGLELRELHPRRFGLTAPPFRWCEDEEQQFNDPALLDAALVASWLLRFGHVESLNIHNPCLPPFFARVLRVTLPFCSKLETLDLRGKESFSECIVEGVLHGAASIDGLQSLHLMRARLTDQATASLGSLLHASAHTLTHLSFGPDSITEARYITACIEQCSKLEDLDLRCFSPNHEEVVELSEEYIEVTDTLQRLSMENVRPNVLARLLRALSTNQTVKTAKFIVRCEKCPNAYNEVVNVLGNNTVLKKLSLIGLLPPSPECTARVFEAIGMNETLESFTITIFDPFSERKESEEAIYSILQAIAINKTLHSLCLQGSGMSTETLRRIAKSLKANPTLKTLHVDAENLEDEEDTEGFREDVRDSCDRLSVQWNRAGLKQLALVLPESNVETLFLYWTFGLGDPPLVEVMQGLQANQTITRLHLDNIGSYDHADIAALAEFVRKTKVLKKITMIYRIHYPVSGIPLIDALTENTSINYVGFGEFDMDLEACQHFGVMLAKNSTLHWVGQYEHYASHEALVPVAEGMEQNCTMLELSLRFKPRNAALSRIARALAANERRLNRAVDFVLDTIENGGIAACEEAFRLLCHKDSLLEQLINVTDHSATNVLGLIESAKDRLVRSPSGL